MVKLSNGQLTRLNEQELSISEIISSSDRYTKVHNVKWIRHCLPQIGRIAWTADSNLNINNTEPMLRPLEASKQEATIKAGVYMEQLSI